VEEGNKESGDNDRDGTSDAKCNTDGLLIAELDFCRATLPDDKKSQQEGSKEDFDNTSARVF
jgi:hypothetical protein